MRRGPRLTIYVTELPAVDWSVRLGDGRSISLIAPLIFFNFLYSLLEKRINKIKAFIYATHKQYSNE